MKGSMRIVMADGAAAQRACFALRPDSEGFLKVSALGDVLELEATGDSPLGLLRTFDDALAAIRALGVP